MEIYEKLSFPSFIRKMLKNADVSIFVETHG